MEASLSFLRKDAALEARLWLGRARAFAAMPQYSVAGECYRQALQTPGIRASKTLQIQALLGVAQMAEFSSDRCAGARLQQAMKQATKLVPATEIANYPQLLMALGVVFANNGKASCALKNFQQALSLFSQNKDVRGASRANLNLGVYYLQQGDLATAEALLSSAYRKLQASGSSEREEPDVAFAAVWLAACRLGKGSSADVPQLFQQAISIINAHLTTLRTDQGQISYLSQVSALFEAVARYYLQRVAAQPDAATLSMLLHSIESTRGSSLLGLTAGAKKSGEFASRDSGNSVAAAPIRLSAADILPTSPPTVSGPPRLVFKVLPEETLVFLVLPESETKIRMHREKLSRALLRDMIKQARDAIGVTGVLRGSKLRTQQQPGSPLSPSEHADSMLAPLSKALLEPLARFLPPDGTTLLIEPDDALWGVPFAALRVQERYLIDRWPLQYGIAPSVRTLAPAKPWRSGVIIGNPKMPIVPEPTGPLPQLRGAGIEADSIQRSFTQRPQLSASLFKSESATWAALYSKVETADVIHLATHGVVADADVLQSFVALAPSLERRNAKNGQLQLGPDNGLLTVEKLLKSKPQLQADLVTLSACESGLGQITGDGVAGLARAWLGVGARSVLVSQWSVDDDATAELMAKFYEEYLSMSTPDKSRALQLAIKHVRRNPGWAPAQYWAPFLLIGAGDPLSAPQRPVPAENDGLPLDGSANSVVSTPPTMSILEQEAPRLSIDLQIFFEADKALIKPIAFPLLDDLAYTLKVQPDIKRVQIVGYTDSSIPDSRAIALSRRRAESVETYLADKGIQKSRLSTAGFGSRCPSVRNDSAEHRAMNNRVEFFIVEQVGVRYRAPKCSAR